MRVLQINNVYPAGSTGRITQAVHRRLLRDQQESHVIYGRGPVVREDFVMKAAPELIMKAQSLRARVTGYSYGGSLISTWRILRAIRDLKPDVVHVHCVNAYMVNVYRLMSYLKQQRIPTVLTLHAEFMYTGGCTHSNDCDQWLEGCCTTTRVCPEWNRLVPPSFFFNRARQGWDRMHKALRGFESLTVCAVSDWVRERASRSVFFTNQRLVTVLNGIDTRAFHYRADSAALAARLGLEGKEVVLHVTPDFQSEIKGGKHVVALARRMAGQQNLAFVVIGPGSQWPDAPDNIRFLPPVASAEELAAYYSLARVTLLTSIRETFSLVTAESLCCGTPVVGFQSGGPEYIALPGYSEFVPQGDLDALEKALTSWLHKPHHKYLISEDALPVYGQQPMCDKYLFEYERLLQQIKPEA